MLKEIKLNNGSPQITILMGKILQAASQTKQLNLNYELAVQGDGNTLTLSKPSEAPFTLKEIDELFASPVVQQVFGILFGDDKGGVEQAIRTQVTSTYQQALAGSGFSAPIDSLGVGGAENSHIPSAAGPGTPKIPDRP